MEEIEDVDLEFCGEGYGKRNAIGLRAKATVKPRPGTLVPKRVRTARDLTGHVGGDENGLRGGGVDVGIAALAEVILSLGRKAR